MLASTIDDTGLAPTIGPESWTVMPSFRYLARGGSRLLAGATDIRKGEGTSVLASGPSKHLQPPCLQRMNVRRMTACRGPPIPHANSPPFLCGLACCSAEPFTAAACARFGNGWAWLSLNPVGKLWHYGTGGSNGQRDLCDAGNSLSSSSVRLTILRLP
jgi:hypothetical protein